MSTKIRNTLSHRGFGFVAAALLALLASAPALAQEEEAPEDEELTGPLGDELDNYWSVDRELPVVEERLYTRDGRLTVGIHAGLLTSEPFYGYAPVGARLGYFFSDHAGLEIDGEYFGAPGDSPGPLTYTTEITDFFARELEEDFDPRTDLTDRFLWQANAVFVWNPLYGKWSFLNSKLSHFDFNLVAGGGAISVERPLVDRSDAEVVITPTFVFGGGISFFLSPDWTLRADGRFLAYQGAETATQVSFFQRLELPAEFQLGVTYLF